MNNIEIYDEKGLLLRIAGGDEEAFGLIFRRYQQKIYALARHLTESSLYAEEIVQDVFLKIWLKQEQLPAIENFESYLFITARNHIYSYLKAIAKHKVLHTSSNLFIPVEDNNTPEANWFHKESALLIEEAVRRLPEQQSQVFRLSREEGQTREQIATALKISPETVKVHLSRALRSIRAYIGSRTLSYLLWCLAFLGLKK